KEKAPAATTTSAIELSGESLRDKDSADRVGEKKGLAGPAKTEHQAAERKNVDDSGRRGELKEHERDTLARSDLGAWREPSKQGGAPERLEAAPAAPPASSAAPPAPLTMSARRQATAPLSAKAPSDSATPPVAPAPSAATPPAAAMAPSAPAAPSATGAPSATAAPSDARGA